ncbi:MAG TPA: DUF4838 domain-containing protein [Bacteroidales bacterium]|nr:DUF4838 domain-containing protein [Bacteroidales bacterium]
MKKISFLLFAMIVLLPGCNNRLKINGKTGYQIVIPTQADTIEKYSAEELSHYLFEMSHVNLPVVEEKEYNGNKAIYIGRTNYATKLNVDFTRLEEDGYAYRHQNNNFIIAGGSRKGVLYGVYDLLEILGFRKYASDYTYIPKGNSVILPKNDTVYIPRIKYRTTSYMSSKNNAECFNWHKLSSQKETWGSFVHTFNSLVPPEKYFNTHPEYYALRNGKRMPTQLCHSNPEVADILINNLKKQIEEKPQMKYWSVSQNDNDKACLCDNCVKLNEKYGGDKNRNSGAIIYFVNKVAKAIPDKMISTLAYWYTREAPDNIQPEPNVNIMLCNIESLRHRPVFETDQAFSKDLKNWGKIAKDIMIWDYNIQFSNMVSPFPNLHTIKPNINFFTDNNVNAFFMQAAGIEGCEMAELRGYLIAKLLWNPDADDNAIIDDFVNGYYGKGGPYIRQYIDTMCYSLLKTNHQLGIFGSPEEAKDTYLSAEMMDEYNRLFDKAEKAVENNPEMLRHVQAARLPIMYAQIQISRTETDTPRSLFKHDANGRVVADTAIKSLLNKFVDRANKHGIIRLRERSIPPDKYLESYNRIFNKMNEMDSAISFNKKIIPVTSPSKNYKGLEALTDGIFGSFEDWRDVRFDNWVGCEEDHMNFILDLGEVKPIRSVNMDFFDAKDTWYQMFLPEYVTYATSVDGKNYDNVVKVANPNDPNQPYDTVDNMPRDIYVQSFQANMKNCKARYIKVHAENILRCPSWHVRAGDPATIFSDEIVVK